MIKKTMNKWELLVEDKSNSNGFKDPNLEKEIVENIWDKNNWKKIEQFKWLYFSTYEVMDMIRRRRWSNFSDTNSELLSTSVSKALLKQFKKFYNESISEIQDSGFHPLDNKLAKLLILSNWGIVRDYQTIWKDITKEELIRWEKDFQRIWNDNFFNIKIDNPWKIKISHRIEGNKYIGITEWDNKN